MAAGGVTADGLPGPLAATPAGKPRARSLGIPFGGTPGRWNAITDVPGVQVGYTTLIEGESVRTGVTAIHPRGPRRRGRPGRGGLLLPERQRRDDRRVLDRRSRAPRRAGRDHQHPRGRASPTPRSSPGRSSTTPISPTPGCCRWRRRPGTATSTTSTGTTSPRQVAWPPWSRPPPGPVEEGSRRRRHRHELLRVQGRQRHRLPAGRTTPAPATPSACSSRPTSASGRN